MKKKIVLKLNMPKTKWDGTDDFFKIDIRNF